MTINDSKPLSIELNVEIGMKYDVIPQNNRNRRIE
jgi:hypothetical protein